MASTCHMCGSKVSLNGAQDDEVKEGFECDDCNEIACSDCKSWAVARPTDHCQRCRG